MKKYTRKNIDNIVIIRGYTKGLKSIKVENIHTLIITTDEKIIHQHKRIYYDYKGEIFKTEITKYFSSGYNALLIIGLYGKDLKNITIDYVYDKYELNKA